jgi:hypothetical protein
MNALNYAQHGQYTDPFAKNCAKFSLKLINRAMQHFKQEKLLNSPCSGKITRMIMRQNCNISAETNDYIINNAAMLYL